MEEAAKPYIPSAGSFIGGLFGGPVGSLLGRGVGELINYVTTPSGPELLGGPGFDSGIGSLGGSGGSSGGYNGSTDRFGYGWDTVYDSGSSRSGGTGGTSSGGTSVSPSSEAGTPYELPTAPVSDPYQQEPVTPYLGDPTQWPGPVPYNGEQEPVVPAPYNGEQEPVTPDLGDPALWPETPPYNGEQEPAVPPPPYNGEQEPAVPPAAPPGYVDVPVMPTTTAGEDPRTTDPVGGGVGNPSATGSGGWSGPMQQYDVTRTYTAAPAGYRPGFAPEHQYIRYNFDPVGDLVMPGVGTYQQTAPTVPGPNIPPLPPYTGPAMIDPETAFMPPGYARGGAVQGEGGIARLNPRYTSGPGDGMSDDIPATIDGRQRAALSKNEFVFPADVVSDLGNGSSDAGAQVLYAMVDRIRQARHGTTEQPPEIDPEAFLPA